MQYELMGTTVPVVEVTLSQGEAIVSQSGAMAWQTQGISMQTGARGGFMKSLGRMFAGESMFQSRFECEEDGAKIAFASTVPGSIVPYDLTGKPDLIVQKGSFLCAQDMVNIRTVFSKRFSTGAFGGEGFILQELSGDGYAFLEIDGDAVEKTLAPGEVLKVDTGNVAAFEATVSYDIETVKGAANIFFGGEGLFLTRLTGPGKVILQSMNFFDFAGRIIALVPPGNN
ncbi:MAG: TIGR00266 family protein [Clostridia bacterium]|nr:TIGR00266 family protein [Clostridia bacterium]